jgi:hypothetical protein
MSILSIFKSGIMWLRYKTASGVRRQTNTPKALTTEGLLHDPRRV